MFVYDVSEWCVCVSVCLCESGASERCAEHCVGAMRRSGASVVLEWCAGVIF